jgi:hypothetical protein
MIVNRKRRFWLLRNEYFTVAVSDGACSATGYTNSLIVVLQFVLQKIKSATRCVALYAIYEFHFTYNHPH